MRRISIVTLAAALVLLSGCNKEHTSIDIDVENSSDMQLIKLGGSTGVVSATTRASIDSLAEMTGHMGVFCLAARSTDVKNAPNPNNINWGTVVSNDIELYGSTTNGRYWDNVRCEVKLDGDIYRIKPTADQIYYPYYPTTSLYGYDFYGYYPYQSAATYANGVVSVNMNIKGDTDIIYGRSEVIDQAYVDALEDKLSDELKNNLASNWKETMIKSHYSARFFRKHPLLIDDAKMKLEHKLARFCFQVYPGPDKDYEDPRKYEGAKKLHVHEISIIDVENELKLVVADKNNPANNGKLSARSNSVADFVLCNEEGKSLANTDPVKLETEWKNGEEVPVYKKLGDCIMLPPGKSAHLMSVTLADEEGNIYPSETQIAITIKNNENGAKKFEAGKTYNVYLQVSGIKEIGVTAELAEWEESNEEMDLVEFN